MRARVREGVPAHVAVREKGPANLLGSFANASQGNVRPGPHRLPRQGPLVQGLLVRCSVRLGGDLVAPERCRAQKLWIVLRSVAQHVECDA